VPILPSAIDLEASLPFLTEIAELPRIKRGKVSVGIVANRLKPWTNASQLAVEEMKGFAFPLVAELRDTQGYVLANALGKSIFDYHSELVRSHQDDWAKLLRWLKKHT
jgi:chromosome partitioning protein